MSYDVFISYSMGYSSQAYELSGQLSRESIQCYLDCAESGFTLGDYTRNLIEESRVYVMLIGANYMNTAYAVASTQRAADMTKPMLACLADGVQLSEELRERCTLTTEASLLEDILCLLRDDEEQESDESDEATAELAPHLEEEASLDWQTQFSPTDSSPTPTNEDSTGDSTEDEKVEDKYEGFDISEDDAEKTVLIHTEHRGDIKEFYELAEEPNLWKRHDRKHHEEGMESNQKPLSTPNEEEEYEEEIPQSETEDFMQKLSDFFDKNPKAGGALLAVLILILMRYCS